MTVIVEVTEVVEVETMVLTVVGQKLCVTVLVKVAKIVDEDAVVVTGLGFAA